MVLAALILILSTAFFFFYMQATCQRTYLPAQECRQRETALFG